MPAMNARSNRAGAKFHLAPCYTAIRAPRLRAISVLERAMPATTSCSQKSARKLTPHERGACIRLW
jgi:hypothetical protein